MPLDSDRMLLDSFTLDIGGVAVSAASVDGQPFEVDAALRPFLRQDGPGPDLVLDLAFGCMPRRYDPGRLVFDAARAWTLARSREGWVWRYVPRGCTDVSRLALLSPGFESGRFYLDDPLLLRQPIAFPLEYPFDRFLYTALLADRGGLMFHACALAWGERGLLFAGQSEAGKSTMAKQWHRHSDATVLNDERVAVRPCGRGFRLYGTPWHGTAELYAPARAPLDVLFLLKQGPANDIRPLSPLEAVTRLISCTFWPLWSRPGMDRVLGLVHDVAHGVPCYELTSYPGPEIVDLIADHVRRTF